MEELETDADLSRDELSATALRGARFVVISQAVIEAASFLSIIVIARLVDPKQQGLAAIGLVVPVIAYVLTFEGFGSALVQRKKVTEETYRTATTLSLVAGVGLGLLTAAVSDTAGRLVVDGQTATLVAFASLSFLFAAATTVPRARMMRQLNFKLLSLISTVQSLASTVATVVMALLHFGAWALILGALVGSLVDMGMQWAYNPPNRPGWSRSEAGALFSYGGFASLNGLVMVMGQNIDYIVLSIILPSRAVGIYYRAYQFGVTYQLKITVVVQTMLFPLMSRAKDVEAFRHLRSRAVEVNSLTAMPLLGLLIILAPVAVPLLYGPHWTAAIVPTQILTLAGMTSVLLNAAEAPALALGRPRRVFLNMACYLVVYGIGIAVAGRYGLLAACIASAAIHLLFLFITQHVLVNQVIGLPWYQLGIDAGPASCCTAVCMAAAEAIRVVLPSSLPAVLIVGVCGTAGFAVYIGALRLLFPTVSRRQGQTILNLVRRRHSVPPVAPASA